MTAPRSRAFWSGLSALGFTTAAVGAVLAFNHPMTTTPTRVTAQPPARTHAAAPHRARPAASPAPIQTVVFVPAVREAPASHHHHAKPKAHKPAPQPTPTTSPTPTPTPICVVVVCLSQGGQP